VGSGGNTRNWGMGKPSSFSGDSQLEVYTQVKIEDLATAVKKTGDDYVSGTTKVAILYDAKSQNTNGGSASGASWNTRILNTKVDPGTFVTFGSSNTGTNGTNTSFSLPAGSYHFEWRAPAYDAGLMRARLAYNVNSDFSGTTNYILGESAQSDAVSEANTFAFGTATLTPAATTYFRIEHYPSSVNGSLTLGLATNIAEEIYTQVIIQDLKTAVKDEATTSIVKQIQHANGPATQQSYNGASWTTIVEKNIILTASNNVLINVKAGFYAGDEGTAYQGGRLLRTTSSTDTSLWEYSSIWGRVGSGSGFKASIDGPTIVDTPGVGTHTYKWQTYQHDASGSNNVFVPANGNSITLTEYT